MNYTMHWVSQQEIKFCSRILEKEHILVVKNNLSPH